MERDEVLAMMTALKLAGMWTTAMASWPRSRQPEDGSRDVFVHISALERAGLGTLNEGQKVSFEVMPGRDGKSSAENLAVVG